MRPRVAPSFRLKLTDLNHSQVCSWAESGLLAYTPTFVVL